MVTGIIYKGSKFLESISPREAAINTATQTGHFQIDIMHMSPITTATSVFFSTALIQIGSYSAAMRSPTTDAFIPTRGPLNQDLLRNVSQNGTIPIISRNDGMNIIIRHSNPINNGLLKDGMTVPKYAANVNNGPGIACAAPYPAIKES